MAQRSGARRGPFSTPISSRRASDLASDKSDSSRDGQVSSSGLRRGRQRPSAALRKARAELHAKGGYRLFRLCAEYKAVELAVVAPRAGVMAAAARDALESRGPSLHVARYSLFRKLLRFAGIGPGRDELLSYLFFDRVYAAAQMQLGAQDASKVRDWET